ncbi:hypothetical protein Tco_0096671 [Tanacetum coccineum]
MQTRSSSNLAGNSSSNPTTTNPKRRNRRRSNQRVEPFALEESPVVTMVDQRTMAELLRTPTKGYAEAIVVPPILAEHFELKHSLINMMTSDQFFGLEKDNPRCTSIGSNKITSTINSMIFLEFVADGNILKEVLRCVGRLSTTNPRSQFTGTHRFSVSQVKSSDLVNYFLRISDKLTHAVNQADSVLNEMQNSIQASMSNQTNELKNMMASFFQMNIASTSGTGSLPSNTVANPKGELKAITTRSGLVLDGPSVPMPHPFINLEEDERVKETLTDPEHGEYTIKVPPPQV